jgi:F-type H+-transporting ATPase subunit delta
VPQAASVARRYADAYFALAQEAGDIEGWSRQLARDVDVLNREDVSAVLDNPRLSAAQRIRLALSLLEGVSQPARNLARLLVERRRTYLLPQIQERYRQLADQASGVLHAEVVTAVEVNDQVKRDIERALERKFGATVKTEVRSDSSILGGLVVRVGDRVIDDSLRTRLQQLQASLA